MPRTVFYTASSLDGFIADEGGALDWLFAVDDGGDEADAFFGEFYAQVGALVEGSTTYSWVVDQEKLLAEPERWQTLYGTVPTFVFSSRDLPTPDGADVRVVRGDVVDTLPSIWSAAGDKDVWVVGGGDLAGQFLDAGALDQIVVAVAPVTLGGGAPLLPRRVEASRLRLADVTRRAQFAYLTYDVVPATEG
ncbi:dihydrofolate reductase family protein [Paraoerskovia marina]|uniref:dihydrofolate reductase family protein n=1 Tax=Paraoerskovia marina TaxID=545619 RepID=UPI0004925163|nr:dihydrofolate reductase family protein [Paraoerskovia marina]